MIRYVSGSSLTQIRTNTPVTASQIQTSADQSAAAALNPSHGQTCLQTVHSLHQADRSNSHELPSSASQCQHPRPRYCRRFPRGLRRRRQSYEQPPRRRRPHPRPPNVQFRKSHPDPHPNPHPVPHRRVMSPSRLTLLPQRPRRLLPLPFGVGRGVPRIGDGRGSGED
jgi:hypothetical protein